MGAIRLIVACQCAGGAEDADYCCLGRERPQDGVYLVTLFYFGCMMSLLLCVRRYVAGLFPLGDSSELSGALLISTSTSLGCLPLRRPMPMSA